MAWHPFRHIGLKALALILGALLWFVTSGERTVERNVRVPLAFRNLPPAIEMTGSPPDTIAVLLRGGSGQLGRLQQGDVTAYVDLTDAQPGPRVVNLQTDAISVPFGVAVRQVLTPRVAFELERSATATVPVVAKVEGEPAAGYARGAITVDPDKVEIAGPESHVRNIDSVVTDPISIAGATSIVHQSVSMAAGDPTVRLRNPQDARVTIDIASALDHTVLDRPVGLRNLRPGLTATAAPDSVTITLRGARAVLTHLSDDAVLAYVDLEGAGRGQYNLAVRVDLQSGLTLGRIDPAMVSVRVK